MRGHVRKRGTKWCFVLDIGRDPITGKRQQKWFSGFKTKKEAEKEMVSKMNEIEKGTFVVEGNVTLEKFLYSWLEEYAQVHCAPKTFVNYEYVIHKHIIPSLGKMILSEVKPVFIQKYCSDKLIRGRIDGKGGLSAGYVSQHYRLLHEIFEHAVKWQIIPTNPVKSVLPPRIQKKKLNVLTKEQIHLVLQASQGEWYYDPIFLAINTGMRRGEILGLQWQDIDFEKCVISVNRIAQRVKRRGVTLRDTTKTENGRRSIAVSTSVITRLEFIKKEQEKQKTQIGLFYQDSDLVFATTLGNPRDPDKLSREFAELVRKIAIPHVRFHDLRHSHATLLLKQGEHPKVVAERLGHSTISITMDTYSHVMPNMQKEASERLDSFLFGDSE